MSTQLAAVPEDPSPPRQRPRLGEWLVQQGLVTVPEVESALREQSETGERLGEILIARGALYAADLGKALGALFGLGFRDLSTEPPDPLVMGRLPEGFCRQRCALPVDLEGDTLVVAVADPTDVLTLDDLQVVGHGAVKPVVGDPQQLRRAIEVAFAADPTSTMGDDLHTGEGPTDQTDISARTELTQHEEPVVRFVNQLLRRALHDRASDLHLEPTEQGLRIRFRIDGMLRDTAAASMAVRSAIVSRLKVMAGMDIADTRRPQDGRISVRVEGHPIDIRVASLPTVQGEALLLRLLDRDHGLLDVDELGLLPDAKSRYEESYHKPAGLILIVGPTGCGKSTTLYATLNELNDPGRNTVTVEDPVEYRLAGIKQTQVSPKAGYTFATGLKAVLRSDPDVILIGEIRDGETARIAAEAALTGHQVFSTLHTNDAASSIGRLIDMGLESFVVSSALECVLAQRLVRQLCRRCRVAYAPGPEDRARLEAFAPSLEIADRPLYRAVGCADCSQEGYTGRLAVQEVMPMTAKMRALILDRRPPSKLQRAAVKGGMRMLPEDGVMKALAGATSLDELTRVIV